METDAMNIQTCPCGSTNFIRHRTATGVWVEHLKSTPGVMLVTQDSTAEIVKGPQPKTIRCAKCGKQNSNPDWK